MQQPVKLNFVLNTSLSLLNTDYRSTTYVVVNDWYSPVGTSRQPNFYDFWSANYQHYVAQGANMRLRYTNMSTTPAIIGVVTWPDIGVTIPNATGIASLLAQYPGTKLRIAAASPVASCTGSIQYSDSLADMYARYPSTTTNQFQLQVKASTVNTHPYPMWYLIWMTTVNGGTPTSTITLQIVIEMEYTGYFTDRANSYDSIQRPSVVCQQQTPRSASVTCEPK